VITYHSGDLHEDSPDYFHTTCTCGWSCTVTTDPRAALDLWIAHMDSRPEVNPDV
jgi:hypothetical protein